MRRALMFDGVLLATMLVYLRCLGNGFVFDDHEMIVLNRYIGDWSFLWKSMVNDSWWFRDPLHLPQSSYYRPLQDIWLAIHYHLFGFTAGGWHATMVALHLAAVWLVYRIAVRILGDWRPAMLAALIFGLLPVHAEAIVWPTAIPLPLSATLELAALYLFIERANAERRNWILACGLYAGALLSHESAVAFPGLVASYVFFLEADKDGATIDRRLRRALLLIAPFAIEMLLYLVVRRAVLGFINRPNPVNHATVAQVAMTAPWVLATYMLLLAVPWVAGPSHRVVFVSSLQSPGFYVPVIVLAVVAGAFAILIRLDRRRRLYLFCAAWMGIAVVPMLNLSGLFQQGLVQDRYLYMASFGFCLMFADATFRLVGAAASQKRVVWSGVGALIVLYAFTLWHVQHFWHDEVALFTRCIEKFPESSIWHNRLGMALEQRGDLTAAERELSIAQKLDPEDGATLFDLGLVHAHLGRAGDAAREVSEGLTRLPHAPAGAYVVLARLYDASGDRAKSDAALAKAETLPGGMREAALARATISMAHNDNAGAERMLRDLLKTDRDDPRAWSALGSALAAQNHNDDALDAFGRAIAIAPRDPQAHLEAARTLHKIGRDEEAYDQCRMALALEPNDPGARALIVELTRNLSNK